MGTGTTLRLSLAVAGFVVLAAIPLVIYATHSTPSAAPTATVAPPPRFPAAQPPPAAPPTAVPAPTGTTSAAPPSPAPTAPEPTTPESEPTPTPTPQEQHSFNDLFGHDPLFDDPPSAAPPAPQIAPNAGAPFVVPWLGTRALLAQESHRLEEQVRGTWQLVEYSVLDRRTHVRTVGAARPAAPCEYPDTWEFQRAST